MGIAPPPPGSGPGLVWTDPPEWESQPPSSSMRRAQYRIPGEAGDAECVVFYFGPGQGGGVEDNVARWAGQFSSPEGTPVAPTVDKMDVSGIPVTTMEVAGTYNGGNMMGASTPEPGAKLLAAIAVGADANVFFKLTGPEATVDAARPQFEALVKSIRGGGEAGEEKAEEAPASQPTT